LFSAYPALLAGSRLSVYTVERVCHLYSNLQDYYCLFIFLIGFQFDRSGQESKDNIKNQQNSDEMYLAEEPIPKRRRYVFSFSFCFLFKIYCCGCWGFTPCSLIPDLNGLWISVRVQELIPWKKEAENKIDRIMFVVVAPTCACMLDACVHQTGHDATYILT
jgi:hypothetical protein